MLSISIKLKEINEFSVLMHINLTFLGYKLIDSNVYFNKSVANCEWSQEIDLIRWWYKTSRK